jgi:hypothetical protein
MLTRVFNHRFIRKRLGDPEQGHFVGGRLPAHPLEAAVLPGIPGKGITTDAFAAPWPDRAQSEPDCHWLSCGS